MKIRVKFTKQGNSKFVGHLDTVRFFQRAIRQAGIPIAYSEGFNPHARVYFAMPLSVGVSSIGEYMDIMIKEDMDAEGVKEKLNKVLPKDIQIIKAFVVEGKQDSLMSLVERAKYRISIQKDTLPKEYTQIFSEKLQKEALEVQKKTKKGLKQVDIKHLIFEIEIQDRADVYEIQLEAAAGSTQNLSPDLFLTAILGKEVVESLKYEIIRLELFTMQGEQKIPIENSRQE
jgi:radical SAM-linked protein